MKSNTQTFSIERLHYFHEALADVMEIMSTAYLRDQVQAVEQDFNKDPTPFSKARLGIVYHEAALNLGFLTRQADGYAEKSFQLLTVLEQDVKTPNELLPFVSTYRASALSLLSAERKNLKILSKAFALFDAAVKKYAHVSYLPEFLRGSVAENLPWFLFRKRSYARKDFASIIAKYNNDKTFADAKIMSFTYWAWANQHRSTRHRKQAIEYLNLAIQLDPDGKAARSKAEDLLQKLES